MLAKIKTRSKDMVTLRQLFLKAEAFASAEGLTEPGSEHLVMAAMTLPDETAHRAFDSLGVSPAKFTSAVLQQYMDALTSIGVDVRTHLIASDRLGSPTGGLFRSKPSAQTLIKRLAKENSFWSAPPLLSANVVLAALSSEIGVVARALAVMRVSPHQLASACQLEIDAYKSLP